MGDAVGVDSWDYQTADGRSIRAALDYLIPFAGVDTKPWPHKEINYKDGTPFSLQGMYFRRAALKMREPKYEETLMRLSPDYDKSAASLLWSAPKPAEVS